MKQLANWLIDLLRNVLADWFAWVAILAGTIAIALSSIAVGETIALSRPSAKTLDIVAIAWILLGALWTALGAHASPAIKPVLEEMSQTGQFDPKILANMLLANSRFATYGALMILVGSAVLVVKLFLPSGAA